MKDKKLTSSKERECGYSVLTCIIIVIMMEKSIVFYDNCGIRGGGSLEKYLSVSALKPFINMDLVLERMVAFRIPEVEGLEKAVKGLPADLFIDICQGFVSALSAHYSPNSETKLTTRQIEMCTKASMFLAACAKVGLDALIDEATGFQFDREQDALQVKLKAYLGEELRKWEKTFRVSMVVFRGHCFNWNIYRWNRSIFQDGSS